jgi:ATP-dependent Zn protease
MDCSNETAALVDKAVQRLLSEAYAGAKQVLAENRDLLVRFPNFCWPRRPSPARS